MSKIKADIDDAAAKIRTMGHALIDTSGLVDIRPIRLALHKIIAEDLAANITSQGANIGRTWRPLESETIKARKRKGIGGTEPLQATGATLSSVSTGNSTSTRTRFRYALKSIGKHRDKALQVQNYGSEKLNIPARQFLYLSIKARELINAKIKEALGISIDKLSEDIKE